MKAFEGIRENWRQWTLDALRWLILALSIGLIGFISFDIFKKIDFMHNPSYMKFQLWVCLIFTADFFIEFGLTPRERWGCYLRRRWIYLVLSIPYLTIFTRLHIHINHDVLYLLRFMPLARGALALGIIYHYLTNNRITTILATYITILIIVTYFSAVIFYERELTVNPDVNGFGNSLWWACMQVTTLGCDIFPVTVTGKILSVILSAMGIVMFPLFTVYVTDTILRHRHPLIS